MAMNNVFAGQKHRWIITEKPLGSGDAGIVYLAHSDPGNLTGIIKKPSSDTFGDIARQSTQIDTEGKILHSLMGLNQRHMDFTVCTPRLLDRSMPGTEGTNQYFIVTEMAAGKDLRSRHAVYHKLNMDFPELDLLRALSGLFRLLDEVHRRHVLWNDVKPEHIFWDEKSKKLTFIDWGNSQFLNENGETEDKRKSTIHDYIQLVPEMGTFLAAVSPDLKMNLLWPESAERSEAERKLSDISQRVDLRLEKKLDYLAGLKSEESQLLRAPSEDRVEHLREVQTELARNGVEADRQGSNKFYASLILPFIRNDRLDKLRLMCEELAKSLPPEEGITYAIIMQLTGLRDFKSWDDRKTILEMTLNKQWAEAHWLLGEKNRKQPQPWWPAISAAYRQAAFNMDKDHPTLFVQANMLLQKLRGNPMLNRIAANLESIVETWRSEVTGTPAIDTLLRYEIQGFPASVRALDLDIQPLEHAYSFVEPYVRSASAHWSEGNLPAFLFALHEIFLRDPARYRLFTAEKLCHRAEAWLAAVKAGPDRPSNEAERKSFAGRQLANGQEFAGGNTPQGWLADILSALKQVETGASLRDIARSNSAVLRYMPWISQQAEREKDSADPKQEEAIKKFHQGLRSFTPNTNRADLLNIIRDEVPGRSLPAYEQLVTAFETLVSDNPQASNESLPSVSLPDQKSFPEADKLVIKTRQALINLTDWIETLKNHDFEAASKKMNFYQDLEWSILLTAKKRQEEWAEVVEPLLDLIKSPHLCKTSMAESTQTGPVYFHLDALQQVAAHLGEAALLWSQFLKTPDKDEKKIDSIKVKLNQAKDTFTAWRNLLAGEKSFAVRALSNLKSLRDFPAELHKFMPELQHLQSCYFKFIRSRHRYKTIDKKEANRALELFKQINQTQFKSPSELINAWIEQYKQITSATSRQAKREAVRNLQSNHPLYDWLMDYPIIIPDPDTWRKLLFAGGISLVVIGMVFAGFILRQFIIQAFNEKNITKYANYDPKYEFDLFIFRSTSFAESTVITQSPPEFETPEPTENVPNPMATEDTPSTESVAEGSQESTTPTEQAAEGVTFDKNICEAFKQLAVINDWNGYLSKLNELSEDQKAVIQAECGWQYTVEQKRLDVQLIQKQIDAESIPVDPLQFNTFHQQAVGDFALPDNIKANGEFVKRYYPWLRQTIAMCGWASIHPDQSSDKIVKKYYTDHIKQYGAEFVDNVFKAVCGEGSPENILAAVDTPVDLEESDVLRSGNWITDETQPLYKTEKTTGSPEKRFLDAQYYYHIVTNNRADLFQVLPSSVDRSRIRGYRVVFVIGIPTREPRLEDKLSFLYGPAQGPLLNYEFNFPNDLQFLFQLKRDSSRDDSDEDAIIQENSNTYGGAIKETLQITCAVMGNTVICSPSNHAKRSVFLEGTLGGIIFDDFNQGEYGLWASSVPKEGPDAGFSHWALTEFIVSTPK